MQSVQLYKCITTAIFYEVDLRVNIFHHFSKAIWKSISWAIKVCLPAQTFFKWHLILSRKNGQKFDEVSRDRFWRPLKKLFWQVIFASCKSGACVLKRVLLTIVLLGTFAFQRPSSYAIKLWNRMHFWHDHIFLERVMTSHCVKKLHYTIRQAADFELNLTCKCK